MGKKTVLTPSSKDGETLRTTVPVNIVRQFNLKAGDKLDWSLKIEDGKMNISVKPNEGAR